MKNMFKALSFFMFVVFFNASVFAEAVSDEPLGKLMQGNSRYTSGQTAKKNSGDVYRKELAKGQHPYAVVVTCSDSRVAPEIIFDEDLGKIFVVRTAGNVVDDIALGSIEYGVEHLHSPLVVILGHENCGAVKAAVELKGEPEGNIGTILKKILPSVEKAKTSIKPGEDLYYLSTIENIRSMAREIGTKSPIIAHSIHEGKVALIGAFYSISSGKVETIR